jgi:hypothetical protein
MIQVGDQVTDFRPAERRGYFCIEVLTRLYGRQWSERAHDLLTALRPSRVRVLGPRDEEKTDACLWRVTVHVDAENRILDIVQEIETSLASGFRNGGDAQRFYEDRADVCAHRYAGPGRFSGYVCCAPERHAGPHYVTEGGEPVMWWAKGAGWPGC